MWTGSKFSGCMVSVWRPVQTYKERFTSYDRLERWNWIRVTYITQYVSQSVTNKVERVGLQEAQRAQRVQRVHKVGVYNERTRYRLSKLCSHRYSDSRWRKSRFTLGLTLGHVSHMLFDGILQWPVEDHTPPPDPPPHTLMLTPHSRGFNGEWSVSPFYLNS